MAASKQDLIDRLTGDPLDEDALAQLTEIERREDIEERRASAAVVAAALANPAGAKFLDWLCDRTIKRRPNGAEVNAVTAEAYAIAKAERTGQNAIYFIIVDALAEARGAKSEETPL